MQCSDRKPIRFDRRNKAICDNGIKLRGVTALLKQAFYPDYVYTRPADPCQLVIGKQVKRLKGSQRVGTMFDSKVGQTIKLQRKYQLSPNVFWSIKQAQQVCSGDKRITAYERRSILAISKRKHPYVQRFWRMMQMYNWQPISSQEPVRHDHVRIGTMIDVVCKDNKVSPPVAAHNSFVFSV